MRCRSYVASCCAVAAIATVVTVFVWRGCASATSPDELRRLHEYCSLIRASLLMDAVDLESDDPARRRDAAKRTDTPLHSRYEISLCAPVPPDLSLRDACHIFENYPCLARSARAAAASIPELTPR